MGIVNVAVAGAGVAGSLLANLLENDGGYRVTVYDGNRMRGHGCAWGCFYTLLKEQLGRVGLNVDDYVLCKTETLVLNGTPVKLRNEVAIDKPKMLEDLYPSRRVVKKHLPDLNVYGADLVVNATSEPLTNHYTIMTRQYKVEVEGAEKRVAYINMNPNIVGYSWLFPLDEDGENYHLGAGCINVDPHVLIGKMMERYRFKVKREKCSCSKSIKVLNPDKTVLVKDKVVCVGEAAGCVYPITGEGIIPSMQSANILYNALKDGFPKSYEENMANQILNGHKKAFKVWRFMDKHARLAWLYGFRHMAERAKERSMPVLNAKTKLKLYLEILFGS